jgi:hypothetical protein
MNNSEPTRYLEYGNNKLFTFSREEVKQKEINLIHEMLREHILSKKFPCVFGKSIFVKNQYIISFYDSIKSEKSLLQLGEDLLRFKNEQKQKYSNKFSSFVSVFLDCSTINNEEEFDNSLWEALSFLNKQDQHDWDQSVSSNPADGNFSFSFGGRAYFVIGLNKYSTRLSRQFKYHVLVFNARYLFDKLRELGTMEKYRQIIRKRDINFQGYINQNLVNYSSTDSEAKLYGGKHVDINWLCPFIPKKTHRMNSDE